MKMAYRSLGMNFIPNEIINLSFSSYYEEKLRFTESEQQIAKRAKNFWDRF